MDGAEVVADALGRVNRILHRAIDGVAVETLNARFGPADVHLFDPKDFATLVGYFDAVAEKSLAIIEGLTEADMDRVVESTIPGRPPQPTTQRLAVILNDNIQHVGQVAYLRGLIRGHGWY